QDRAETLRVVRIAAGGDRAERAAVEGAGEGDDVVALGLTLGEEIMPRRLDRAFDRLSARIGEEDSVGEGRIDQALPEPLLLGNGEDIGGMPDLVGGCL